MGRFLPKRIVELLKPNLRYGVFALVLMLASVLLQMPLPLVSAWIIDRVFQRREFQHLGLAIGVMFATGVILLAVRFGQAYWSTLFIERSKARCVAALMSKALAMSTPSFHRRSAGYLLARLKDDVGAIDALLTTLVVALGDGATILLVALVMVRLNFRLAAMSTLVVPLYVLVIKFFNQRLRSKIWNMSESSAFVTQELQETLASHDLIKTFGAESYHRERFSGKLASLVSAKIGTALASAWGQAVTGLITILLPGGILWYGAYEFIKGRLSLGGLFAFNTYLAFLLGSANGLMSINFSFQAFRVAISRIAEILDEKDDLAPVREPSVIANPRGAIEFTNVCFSYASQEHRAVDGISLRLKAGEHVALVGRSGAGKTTLMLLLLRLYEPQQGRILLDGTSVGAVDPAQLRKLIAVVPQETLLITGTVAENIRYNSLGTDEEMREAAMLANADEFISALPRQYETVIGQGGFNFSSGQRQRIAIARALLKKPRVLILDEASSALDSWSEQMIQESIVRLRGTMTIITIAHRLYTVQSADRIFFLEHGRLTAEGAHEFLYGNCPKYAQLFDLQFPAARVNGGNEAAPGETRVTQPNVSLERHWR